MTGKYLAPQDIADDLGVDVETVRRWIKAGRLRAFKPGKEYRIRESDLEEFLRAREVRPKASRRSPFEPSLLNGLEEERRSPLVPAITWLADVWTQAVADPRTTREERLLTVMYARALEDQLSVLLGTGDLSPEEQREVSAASSALGRVDEQYADLVAMRDRLNAAEAEEARVNAVMADAREHANTEAGTS